MTATTTAIEQAQLEYDVAKGLAQSERQKIADAQAEVRTAEVELESAALRFKEKPTASTASAKMVAEQVLENARERLAKAQDAAGPVLKEETLAKFRLEYAICLAKVATYESDLNAETQVIIEGEAMVRGAIERMRARNREMQATVKAISVAASSTGLPVPVTHFIENHYLPQHVNAAIRAKYGEQRCAYNDIESLKPWLF